MPPNKNAQDTSARTQSRGRNENQDQASNHRGTSGTNVRRSNTSDCFHAIYKVRNTDGELIEIEIRSLPMIATKVLPSKEESQRKREGEDIVCLAVCDIACTKPSSQPLSRPGQDST